MNKFPYIGENRHGVIMLILSRSKAVILSDVNKGKTHSIPDSKENPSTWFERKYKNITAEYLANAKVKIESEEHEIFVRELSSSANLKCAVLNEFVFIFDDFIEDANKLITIPLPPKKKSMESQREWPQVGDEVLYDGSSERLNEIKGEIVKVIGKCSFDADNYVTVKHNEHGVFAMRLGSWIKKPPAPEEDLRSKLISVMDNSNTAFTYADFISKAIINGEIEGLEYKPQ